MSEMRPRRKPTRICERSGGREIREYELGDDHMVIVFDVGSTPGHEFRMLKMCTRQSRGAWYENLNEQDVENLLDQLDAEINKE